jgi:hypothetical protein
MEYTLDEATITTQCRLNGPATPTRRARWQLNGRVVSLFRLNRANLELQTNLHMFLQIGYAKAELIAVDDPGTTL